MTEHESSDLLWPDEPDAFLGNEADHLMYHAYQCGASDTTIMTGNPVICEISGRNVPITRKKLSHNEVELLLVQICDNNQSVVTQIATANDVDRRFSIKPSKFSNEARRSERIGFRVNATAILLEGKQGVQITLRSLPSIPPGLEELGVEPEITEALKIRDGMFLVTGPTGSGKSTLLSSGIRYILEGPENHYKILTYESPIEYTYDKVNSPYSTVAQTEIPTHLKSGFSGGIRNALRRKPSHILIGEARDAETIGGLIEASLTGHVALSTTHSKSVASTVRRLIIGLQGAESVSEVDLIDSLRMVVTQILVPKVGGGRTALREFLFFDDYCREILMDNIGDGLVKTVTKLVKERGQPMSKAARTALDAGLIDEHIYKRVIG
jgi:defect-in-organelle-trafficking protein DotB